MNEKERQGGLHYRQDGDSEFVIEGNYGGKGEMGDR